MTLKFIAVSAFVFAAACTQAPAPGGSRRPPNDPLKVLAVIPAAPVAIARAVARAHQHSPVPTIE